MIEINGVYYTINHYGLFMFLGIIALLIVAAFIWAGIEGIKDAISKKKTKESK